MKQPFRLRLNLQYFSDSNPPADPPQDPPAGGTDPEPPVTYSQEQFDTQLADAKKEAARQAKTDMYKQLGVESLKDLQAKLSAAEGKEQADEVLRTTNEQLTNRTKELETELAFVKAATVHKPHDTSLLFTAVQPLLTTDPDSGEITNMKEAIEQVKTEKPFLFVSEEAGCGQGGGSQKPGSTAPGGGNPPASATDYDKGAELAKKRSQSYQK